MKRRARRIASQTKTLLGLETPSLLDKGLLTYPKQKIEPGREAVLDWGGRAFKTVP